MGNLGGVQSVLDAIYPARCLGCGDVVHDDFGLCGACWRDTSFIGGTVCDGCGVPLMGDATGDAPRCDACLKSPPVWGRGRAAVLYKDTGRKLVLALKHGDRQEIAKPASRWLAQAAKGLLAPETLIAPVPLHWLRLIKRRYNQSALLADALAAELGQPVCADLLQRARRTRSLDGMNREQRRETLTDAIRVHPRRRHRLAGRPVLIIDDVMTTGATLSACARACLDGGAAGVNVLTLARVAKDP